jgi:hypothetical protein
MALTEAEELELLELEEQEAIGTQTMPPNGYQPSLLQRAADVGTAVQNAVIPPLASASDTAARGFAKAAFGTDVPVDWAQKGLGAVTSGLEKAGEYVAEEGGRRFPNLPAAVPATAGFLVANAPNMIPLGKGATINTALKPAIGKPGIAARLKQMRTGVDASAFEQLRRDPTAFFNTTSRKAAGEAIGEAKQAAGVNLGVTGDIKSLTKENLGRARSPMAASNKAQDAIADKIATAVESNPTANPSDVIRSSGITADEAATALDGINKRLAKLERSEGPGSPSFQKWTAIKSHVQSVLEEVAPEVKAANKEFSRVALRDKFMEPMPVNQSGTMSKISTFGFTPAGAGVGGIIGSVGGPIGSAVGAVIGAGAVQAARSPFVAGLGTATRGLIDKAVDPVLSRTASELSRRALITTYITKHNGQEVRSDR